MTTYEDTPPGGSGDFRLRELWRWRERFVDDFNKWRRETDVQVAKNTDALKTSEQKMDELLIAFDSLRKTLLTFAFTIAAACIGFALTVLTATGKI